MELFSLFSAIFMVVLVLLLAWLFSRQLGSRYMKASSVKNIRPASSAYEAEGESVSDWSQSGRDSDAG